MVYTQNHIYIIMVHIYIYMYTLAYVSGFVLRLISRARGSCRTQRYICKQDVLKSSAVDFALKGRIATRICSGNMP